MSLAGLLYRYRCDMSGSWDEKTLTAHGILSMKHLAVAAGIGFMGKNTLLCNERFREYDDCRSNPAQSHNLSFR
jgi:hypothetical protein